MQKPISTIIPPHAHGRLIYLLHYPKKLSRARHYLGIVNIDRADLRMKEHAGGRASAFTRAIGKLNEEFHVTRVWTYADHDLERSLKRSGHHELKCPVCSGKAPIERFPTYRCWVSEQAEQAQLSFVQLTSFHFKDTGWNRTSK